MKRIFNYFVLISIIGVCSLHAITLPRRKNVGIFRNTDPQLYDIRFGNWGSRPFEYYWAATVVPVKNKRIIDLGIGIPSQYNWYEYVTRYLKPSFYAGIDWDERIHNELKKEASWELKHMNMATLDYPSSSFDVAYCISTFEHLEYPLFIASIKEAYRVLKNEGILVITLDEAWDYTQARTHENSWNNLEQSVDPRTITPHPTRSFGLPEFLELIKDYFVLIEKDAHINHSTGTIESTVDGYCYYKRTNADPSILNSGPGINSCVSYAVVKKVGRS